MPGVLRPTQYSSLGALWAPVSVPGLDLQICTAPVMATALCPVCRQSVKQAVNIVISVPLTVTDCCMGCLLQSSLGRLSVGCMRGAEGSNIFSAPWASCAC